ncbi:hypothetical protein A9O63_14875 [Cereibacter johrii]|nr:hypothetical protein A9O63_14875 [Cereibacter johrii]
MATSPKDPAQASGRPTAKRLKASHWFWGTIAVLLLVTLALHFAASRQLAKQGAEGEGKAASQSPAEAEAKATQVEHWFAVAGEEAAKVRAEIDPMLDKAYAPVYAGIPAYMVFHYSLKGEWLELGAAAIGEISSGLDKYMFAGLDRRLDSVAADLGREFDQRYFGVLDRAMAELPGGAEALGPVVARALKDSKIRITKTGGMVALEAVALKGMTKVFATKLGVKLAAKVAAKTGTKWAATLAGGGTGAAVCSWTGPGAAACGLIGAGIAWVGADVAMIKLEEYLKRDDFEKELRALVDEHKAETRKVLEAMLAERGKERGSAAKVAVGEVALSELADADRQLACKTAGSLLVLYTGMRDNLQARSPAQVAALEQGLRAQAGDHLLAPWVEGMEQAIPDPDQLRPQVVGSITVTVEVPLGLREEQESSGKLTLGTEEIVFDWAEANTAGGYVLHAGAGEATRIAPSARVALELVQDRGWKHRNRTFTGSASTNVFSILAEGSGLAPRAEIRLPTKLESDNTAGPTAIIALSLSGVMLPERALPDFCTP